MINNKLTRRDFLKLAGATSLGLALSACRVNPTEIPLVAPTLPPVTMPPQSTSTTTPTFPQTSTPMTFEEWVKSNQPDKMLLSQVESLYLNAMGLREDQILLEPQIYMGKYQPYAVIMEKNTMTPLCIAIQNGVEEPVWRKITIRQIADICGLNIAAPFKPQYLDKFGYIDLITENANMAMMTEGLDNRDVFKNFTTDIWNSIINNWDQVKAQLDSGEVPGGYDYYWEPSKRAIDLARQNKMKIVGSSLLWPEDMPDSIFNGGFLRDELSKILEFSVKTRVLQYKGLIHEWIAEAEGIVAIKYMNVQDDYHAKAGLWYRNLGGKDGTDVMLEVGRWAHEADPNAKLKVVEDHIMEQHFGTLQPYQNTNFFNFLNRIKAENVPIDGVDIENNLWIYAPPAEQYMVDILNQIQSMGFRIATPETTVITSLDYPIWYENPPAPPQSVKDPLTAQADLYRAVLNAYLSTGTNVFGFGDITDQYSWYSYHEGNADAMIFDKSSQPKKAYYAVIQTLFNYLIKKK